MYIILNVIIFLVIVLLFSFTTTNRRTLQVDNKNYYVFNFLYSIFAILVITAGIIFIYKTHLNTLNCVSECVLLNAQCSCILKMDISYFALAALIFLNMYAFVQVFISCYNYFRKNDLVIEKYLTLLLTIVIIVINLLLYSKYGLFDYYSSILTPLQNKFVILLIKYSAVISFLIQYGIYLFKSYPFEESYDDPDFEEEEVVVRRIAND